MANLKPIVTTILLLVVIAALFLWSYYDYTNTGQVTFISAVAAASAVALLLSVLKVWNPNMTHSLAGGSSIGAVATERKSHRADDSTSSIKKRWWRK